MTMLDVLKYTLYGYFIVGLVLFPIIFVMAVRLVEIEADSKDLDIFSKTFVVFSATTFLSLFWPIAIARIINNVIDVFKKD